MAIDKISRRQFLTGAAAVAGAAALPSLMSVTPAVATPTGTFAAAATQLTPWVPIDVTAAARRGYEIYRGAWSGQGG